MLALPCRCCCTQHLQSVELNWNRSLKNNSRTHGKYVKPTLLFAKAAKIESAKAEESDMAKQAKMEKKLTDLDAKMEDCPAKFTESEKEYLEQVKACITCMLPESFREVPFNWLAQYGLLVTADAKASRQENTFVAYMQKRQLF